MIAIMQKKPENKIVFQANKQREAKQLIKIAGQNAKIAVAKKDSIEFTTTLTPNQILKRLTDGNKRFVKNNMAHPHLAPNYRYNLADGQHPIAAIVGCADSRVPTEIIFDQGVGDIFVIRNAGHVLDRHMAGSVEYAVEHLGVKLVAVMGHQFCGAVGATMQKIKASPGVNSILKSIQPAIKFCKESGILTYENAIKKHTLMTAEKLEQNPTIKNSGAKVVPMYYEMKSGKVKILKKH